ncbi:MAG TPA: FMN-binding protein [Pseudothermotoga sp.]
MNKEGKFYTILFSFIITFVFVLLLSLLNASTIQRIQNNERLFKIKAILKAFGIEYKNDQEALSNFEKYVKIKRINNVDLYYITSDAQTLYGVVFNGSGLWSNISGFIAVDETVEKIVGIEFISQAETPGLGGRIEEEWFKNQFRSEKLANGAITIQVGGTGDYDHENGKVDAITGATQTSKSLERIINDHLGILRDILGVRQ